MIYFDCKYIKKKIKIIIIKKLIIRKRVITQFNIACGNNTW